jgi:hypothetical protein
MVKGMEELIKQAFLHVEIIGPQVQEGCYDLIGPDGEILLPTVWERVVQPDWLITMHMWPKERTPGRHPWRLGGHGQVVRPGGPMHLVGGRGIPLPPPPLPPGGYGPGGQYRPRYVGRPYMPGGGGKPPGGGPNPITVDSDTESINTLSTSATRDEEEKKRGFGLRRLIPTKIAKIKLWKRSSSSGDSKKTGSQSSFSSLNSSTVSFKTRKK